ncbi:hypothetical protein [uncultured Lutibacter sp.]|uniref:hypothetical protein n=1 Tax=uncultured Lutibacter sp. TaxID=437739 RepID=UPI0026334EB5|nr:hypothetical protein [uncultured Lutibacter sp.]
MKNRFLIILVLVTSFTFAQVNTTPKENKEARDSINFKVSKLMEFYESYEDGSPESLKKAKFNKAADALSEGSISKKDKADAYQIVNAYIKGDKALEQDKSVEKNEDESLNETLEKTEEVKEAQKFLDQQKAMFTQMSYSEFEAYILKISPGTGKKEIKTAYNELHKNDGKEVSITSEDEEMTEAQLQLWAIETLQNPKSCADYRKAINILKIQMPESEIQKACKTINNNKL